MTIADHEWKVGDTVLIDRNRYGSRNPAQIAKIEKVTKTQFTAGGLRFKRWGGDQARELGGDRWHPVTCAAATPKRLAENAIRVKAAAAENVLYRLSEIFRAARQDDAIRIVDALPDGIVAMAREEPK